MRTIAQGLALAVAALVIPACGIEPPKTQEDPPPLTLASPEGGTYDSPLTVMLTSYEQTIPLVAHKPPTIYCSIDGNDPTIGGANTISGPGPWGIPLPEGTTTLKYFAVDSLGNVEPM